MNTPRRGYEFPDSMGSLNQLNRRKQIYTARLSIMEFQTHEGKEETLKLPEIRNKLHMKDQKSDNFKSNTGKQKALEKCFQILRENNFHLEFYTQPHY